MRDTQSTSCQPGPPSWIVGRFSLKICFLLLIFNLFDSSKLCQMCFFRCFREDEKMTTSHLAFQSLCQPRRWRSFSSGGRKPWKQVPHGREPDTLRVSNFEVFFVVSIVSFVSEEKGCDDCDVLGSTLDGFIKSCFSNTPSYHGKSRSFCIHIMAFLVWNPKNASHSWEPTSYLLP